MNWISDLLRQVTVSKTLTLAVFCTSAALLFGPKLFPGFMESEPKDWQFVPAGTLVFSGCFLLVWLASGVWRLMVKSYWGILYRSRSRVLSSQETEFLCSLAKHPDTPINLRAINYDTSPLTRLEFTQISAGLASKGLVQFGPHDRAIVILTKSGEKVALKAIGREQRAA